MNPTISSAGADCNNGSGLGGKAIDPLGGGDGLLGIGVGAEGSPVEERLTAACELGRREEARAEFERAASLTRNARERELLLARAESTPRTGGGSSGGRRKGCSRGHRG